MRGKSKIVFAFLVVLGAILLFASILHGHTIAILNPKGPVAQKEFNLLIIASLMTLIVVIPVFVLTFFIVWKYRAGNTKAKYTPDWAGSRVLETIWWGVPSILILILAVITWQSSHALDPSKPLNSTVAPITIQVVALPWKWLFIYPEQHIATVNYIQFPNNTPVNFQITSDAAMNSFWIPQLGGQIYAMAGMSTQLHLMASQNGSFDGSSANLSGRGFAGMKFIAKSSSADDFSSWVQSVQQSPNQLTQTAYDKLAKPTENNAVAYYAQADDSLYNDVIMKYMGPTSDDTEMADMPGMGSGSGYGMAQP